jgi:hypothetical protein
VVGFTTGSRGKVPGKTCEKRRNNNNDNNNNNSGTRGRVQYRLTDDGRVGTAHTSIKLYAETNKAVILS